MKRGWRIVFTIIAAAGLVAVRWSDSASEYLIGLALVAVAAVGLKRMAEPEPAASCPKCGGPVRALKIPAFARVSLDALILGAGVTVMLAILGLSFAFDASPAVTIAAMLVCIAAVRSVDRIVFRRLDLADRTPPYRCEGCHRRFEAPTGQAVTSRRRRIASSAAIAVP